jgi:hypothetical protein
MRKSLATFVIAATLVIPSAAQSVFVGTWESAAPRSALARAAIYQESGRLMVHLFGQCTPTPCDWGAVPLTQLPDGERKLPDRAFAILNRGGRTTHVVTHMNGQELVIEIYLVLAGQAGQMAPRPGQYFAVTTMARSGDDRTVQPPTPQ